MHLFISHSSANYDVAAEMCEYIEKHGTTCFIAPRDIRSGKEYAEEIINGIHQADAMVLIMSEQSNKSPHVLREVERAVSRGIPILVYKLEDVKLTKSMEYFLMTHQWIACERKKDYSKILAFIQEHEDKVNNKTSDSAPSKALSASSKGKRTKMIPIMGICLAIIILVSVWCIFGLKPQKSHTYQVGDTIVFGTYNEEPIQWRILKIYEDSNNAVLISTDILTMKAYDAAEGGTFNSDGINEYWSQNTLADTDYTLQVQVRGNSDWSSSNIRTWLNSTSEVVKYNDQPPTAPSMSEHYNGYHTEPGFLYAFQSEELEALVETEIVTKGNALSETETVTTNDYVFLLSKDELLWFEESDISLYASPTEAALEQDASNWFDVHFSVYEDNNYFWWLREPVEGSSSQCYMVNNGYTQEMFTTANVGTEGFGIRPAIVVNLEADIFQE